jgi:hypothetical protein
MPSDYPELWRQVLRHGGNSYEFSVGELLEAAIGTDRQMWRRRRAAQPFAHRHVRDARRWLPARVRDPLRVAVRAALMTVINLRQKLGMTATTAELAELDNMALRYLGRDGRLDTVHPEWTLPRLAAHLGAEIEPAAERTGTAR